MLESISVRLMHKPENRGMLRLSFTGKGRAWMSAAAKAPIMTSRSDISKAE
jgi:hypothetical protein